MLRKTKLATAVGWVFMLLLLTGSESFAQYQSVSNNPPVNLKSNKIIVKYKNTPSTGSIHATAAEFGNSNQSVGTIAGNNKLRVFTASDVDSALESVMSDPNVEGAMVSPVFTIFKNSNDPGLSYQWDFKKMNISGNGNSAWDWIPTPIEEETGNVVVAVLDSGVDYTHPDMGGCLGSNCRVIGGRDFINNDNDPKDDFGHGTHVAGTIGALTNNAKGVAGGGWGVKIMAVKVLDSRGGTDDLANIINGIHYAADNGARVINMSFGSFEYDMQASGGIDPKALMQEAIDYAFSKGVVMVAAAGNCGADSPCVRKNDSGQVVHTIVNEKGYPASLDHVISVGALSNQNQKASYSEYGTDRVDVMVPGGNGDCGSTENCILSTYPYYLLTPAAGETLTPNTYVTMRGTSMAAPHAAAVAALIRAANGNLSNAEVVDMIQNHATSLSGLANMSRYGAVDACRDVYAATHNGDDPPVGGSICGAADSDGGDDILATPTPFPDENLCPQACGTFVSGYSGKGRNKGDANCSGSVTLKDFKILRNQFGTIPDREKKNNANFQCKGGNNVNPSTFVVNLGDFEIWRRHTANFGTNNQSFDDMSEEGD